MLMPQSKCLLLQAMPTQRAGVVLDMQVDDCNEGASFTNTAVTSTVSSFMGCITHLSSTVF